MVRIHVVIGNVDNVDHHCRIWPDVPDSVPHPWWDDHHSGPLGPQAEVGGLPMARGVLSSVVESHEQSACSAEQPIGGEAVAVPPGDGAGVEHPLEHLAARQLVESPIRSPDLGQVPRVGQNAGDLLGHHAVNGDGVGRRPVGLYQLAILGSDDAPLRQDRPVVVHAASGKSEL
jgi:hypothetical protein